LIESEDSSKKRTSKLKIYFSHISTRVIPMKCLYDLVFRVLVCIRQVGFKFLGNSSVIAIYISSPFFHHIVAFSFSESFHQHQLIKMLFLTNKSFLIISFEKRRQKNHNFIYERVSRETKKEARLVQKHSFCMQIRGKAFESWWISENYSEIINFYLLN
jgi:hypothetical protein